MSITYLENASGSSDWGQAPAPRWTTGLTWVCVFFALIGLMGLLSGVVGMVNHLSDPAAAKADLDDPRAAKLQDGIVAATSKYKPVFIFLEVVKLGLAGAFLAGCMMMLAKSSGARSFVIMVCCGALFYHVGSAVLQFLLVDAMTAPIIEAGRDAMAQHGPVKAKDEKAMTSFVSAVTVGASIAGFFVLGIKSLFYGWFIYFMSRPHVREIFGEDPYPELTEMKAAAASGW